MSHKIAACLIVRDSAATIERALSSIRPFVDEINVYDTGSTDGTVALLKKLGKQKKGWVDERTGAIVPAGKGKTPEGMLDIDFAPIRVEQGEWRNDFSWAREQSFAMASDDVGWYFWMDDDDFIVGAHHLRPMAMHSHRAVDGFLMFYDYARDEFGNNVCQLWRERLLRRTPGQWVNPIHEVWLPYGKGGKQPQYSVVPKEVCHFVHERPETKVAPTRNLEILQAQQKAAEERGETPEPRVLAYLGSELFGLGRYAEAAQWLDAYLQHPEARPGDERSTMYHKIASCLRNLGQIEAAKQAEFTAIQERDDWTENAAGLAELFYDSQDWNRTITWAQRALALGMPQSALILNPLELVFLPKIRLAEAHAALGDFEEARRWAREAMAHRPGDPFVTELQQRIDSTSATSEIVSAVLTLRETLIRHDENAKAWALMASAVPYVISEHPLISSAKAMTRENVMHMLRPEEYLRWYEDEPKESTVEDEHVKELGDMIERATFTLELARKFEDEHGRKPRILDLGCNDAWLACYLWQEGEFYCDGVELNKASVEKGLGRLARFGAPGTIKQGDIHDAEFLHIGQKYDIVTCYEVYEHVPNTNRLLWTMEKMLTPDGIACVTTPAGAFERGNLEFWHLVERKGHLRAVTPTELASELAGRGAHFEDFQVHQQDALVWAAWKPGKRRKRIHIVAPGGFEVWDARDVRTRGIGGSETCLVQLSYRLGEQGHDVRVFADATPGVVGQTVWRPYAAFDPTEEADTIIVSRIPQMFAVDLHAPQRILWCHDNTYEGMTPETGKRMTDVVVLSEWQRQRFQRLYPWLEDKLRIVRNGIPLHEFAEPEKLRFPEAGRGFAERKPKAVYSSSADRGLDVLLELWPKIRAEVPDAELHIFYGWTVFDVVARTNPALRALKGRIFELAEQAGNEEGGVFMRGRVGQDELYAEMQESRVLAYPTAFLETSCITAMEARAAGLNIVTSDLGALSETVGEHGLLLPWAGEEDEPVNRTEDYQEAFIEEVVASLTDGTHWEHWHAKARENVETLAWEHRIEDWERLLGGEG